MRYLFSLLIVITILKANAQTEIKKDTLPIGIYITSIHNINFKDQEYEIDFWLWINKADIKNLASFSDILNSIEVPESKSKEFQFIDSTSTNNVLTTKVHCTMKDAWNIKNFPFDHQTLQLSIESSIFPSSQMSIVLYNHANFLFDKFQSNNIIQGWNIENASGRIGTATYYTNFGDKSVKMDKKIGANKVEYSKAIFSVEIHRDYWGLFLKIFICMYISFLIAFASFFVHFESIESRLSLSVGALFAVIGNKYITESSLPESTSFTLVDILHALTMFFVLLIITSNTYVLKLVNNKNENLARKIDRFSLRFIIFTYLIINFLLIYFAQHHD